jgi:hypothetical protein
MVNRNLSFRQSLLVIVLVAAIGASVYGIYLLIAQALHRKAVAAAVPKYVEALTADREKITAALERYRKQFGFYPRNLGTNLANRAVENPLYYELVGTRWETNLHAFRLPTTKDPVTVEMMLRAFNSAAFSNRVEAPNWPTNFIEGARLAGREINDVIVVLSPGAEDIEQSVSNDIDISPWRYVADPAEHNQGKFDLWVELEALGQKYTIKNW